MPPELELDADVVRLTRTICDIESVSGNEKPLADAVAAALGAYPHLLVDRDGDAVVARTQLGREQRVILAGHLDTVPVADNLPTTVSGSGHQAVIHGRGTVDMKGGVAVLLACAAELNAPTRDITYVFYDHEEVDAAHNGLGRLQRRHPDWLAGDFAVLAEPTNALVEGGCNGTLRVRVTATGVAAHSARPWMGSNAIHTAGRLLSRLATYAPREVTVDGLLYREALNAVAIAGGIAANVIPDRCDITLNYRFAPDRSAAQARTHLEELFEGYEVELLDASEGARPGLQHQLAQDFVAAVGQPASAKYGWTDVARFSAAGIPAVNFGPGDPSLAHRDDERCPVGQIYRCLHVLQTWLS